MAEVRGSSPLSSTSDPPATLAAYDYRQKFGWYMERAAAGETFLITRRGKPYARLSPPHLQLDLAPEHGERRASDTAQNVWITPLALRTARAQLATYELV